MAASSTWRKTAGRVARSLVVLMNGRTDCGVHADPDDDSVDDEDVDLPCSLTPPHDPDGVHGKVSMPVVAAGVLEDAGVRVVTVASGCAGAHGRSA